jgi:energy-coupling factor transporter ATP-binding protein EcfA2
MASTLFEQRAHQFAEELGDPATAKQVTSYLHHRDLPGPIVTFVGAQGRGKSTLLQLAAQVPSSASTRIRFAAATTWKKTVGEWGVTDSVFLAADSAEVGDALLCDGPPFTDKIVPSLLDRTDFAVFAVQITQPSGADEVAFVRECLTAVPSVLVLTKCDQVDEGEFAEGVEAVLEVYGDFPWVAVLLSDLDGSLEGREQGDKGLLAFRNWWRNEGQAQSEQARRVQGERLGQAWRRQARETLAAKEQEYAPLLEAVREARTVSSTVTQAYRLQDELMDSLKSLPDRALGLYRNRVPELRLRVTQVTNNYVDSIRAGSPINPTAIGNELTDVYQVWDSEARTFVRDEIKATVEPLHTVATRYEDLVRAAAKVEATNEMMKGSHQREAALDDWLGEQATVSLQGDFNLSVSDKIRSTATPVASGLGTGLLLFNVIGATILFPFATFLALLGGVLVGGSLYGVNTEGNRRKLASNVKEAVQRQAYEQEHVLLQRFHSEWADFSHGVRESVGASKRRLDIMAMNQSTQQDGALAKQDAALTQNMLKIEALFRDLEWLEHHEQAPRFVVPIVE